MKKKCKNACPILRRPVIHESNRLCLKLNSSQIFEKILRRIIRKIETRDPAINELIAKLRELPDGVDWKEFEEQFRQVHPEFSGKSEKISTDLRRLNCALLRFCS